MTKVHKKNKYIFINLIIVGKEIDKTKNKEEKISLEEKKIIETYKKDFLELDKTKFKLSDKRLNSKDQEVLSTEGVYETYKKSYNKKFKLFLNKVLDL